MRTRSPVCGPRQDGALAKRAAGVLALLLVGCTAPGDVAGELDEDLFVAVMTRLVLIDNDPAIRRARDSVGGIADSLRTEELRAYGVTAGELIEFASRAGRDPGRMERLWQRIGAGVDSSLAGRRELGESAGLDGRSPAVGEMAPATAPAGADSVSPGDLGPREGKAALRARLDSLRRAKASSDPEARGGS